MAARIVKAASPAGVDPAVFAVDSSSAVPLYHQIKQNLRDLIDEGVLQADQMLPAETELGEHYGVHRLTVRQAIGELVREGVLRRQRGVGTFVAAPKLTQALARAMGFSERIREAGLQPSSRVVSFEVTQAAASFAQRLSVTPGAIVYKLVRLRCADGQPVMLETAWLSRDRFPGLDGFDFAVASLYEVLAERFDCRVVAADETLEPVLIGENEARLLEVRPRTPALRVELISFDQRGQPVEISRSVVRGDKSRYVFHIRRQVWPAPEFKYQWPSSSTVSAAD